MSSSEVILIEIYTSPVCSRCQRTVEKIRDYVQDYPYPVQVEERDVLSHLPEATRLGVYATPAIVINGKLVYRGPISRQQLMKFLQEIHHAK